MYNKAYINNTYVLLMGSWQWFVSECREHKALYFSLRTKP